MAIHSTPYENKPFFRLVLGSLLLCIGWAAPFSLAQSRMAEQDALPAYDTSRAEFHQNQYQKTLQTARLRGWPVRSPLGASRPVALHHTDALGNPVYYTTHNSPLAAGTHTEALYERGNLGLKLSGNSASVKGRLALWDGGNVLATHRELSGKVSQPDAQAGAVANDHATHMAGILVARGTYPQAQGMAFDADLRAWNFDNDFSEIVRQAPNLLISNHAYGPVAGWVLDADRPGASSDEKWEWWGTPAISNDQDYRFGFYDEAVSEVDRITYNFPYFLMVRSADNKRMENGPPPGTKYYLKNTDSQSTLPRSRNDSYDIIPGEANAKNVLTVGAGELRNATLAVTPYSGWGPTDDGRIKPDLLGLGTSVLSSVGTDTDAYGVLTGTSMASANVSGSLLLLQELFHQRSGAFMLASTLKGLALHTADKPEGKTAPSYEYGWGLLNAEKAARLILNADGRHLLAEEVLQQGGTLTQKVVANGIDPLVITICWTDPEAVPTALNSRNVNNPSPRLVNDLDVVVAEGFNAYQPWVPDPAAPGQKAQTGNNIRDNVEQVYIANPLKGRVYTITVSHKNTLKNDRQPFALLASGLARPDCERVASITPGMDMILCPGQTLTLSANAGSGGYTYEWLRDGQVLKQGSERVLEVNRPGTYAVRASTPGCTATSETVAVQGSDLFAAIVQKGDLLVCDSKGIELTANRGNNYTYQWLREGAAVSGATNPAFQATESGKYQVRISQQGCTVLSEATRVEVTPVKAYLEPSATAIICNGNPALLRAPQEKGYAYAWLYNHGMVAGATGATFQATKPGRYAVEVSNGSCRVRSTDVVVQRIDVVATITPPATAQIPPGGSVVLKANYEIGNYYSWYRNDSLLKQEIAPLLAATQGGTYKVTVRNTGCLAESAPVLLWGGTPGTSPLVTALQSLPDSGRRITLYPNPAHETVTVALRKSGSGLNSSATLLTTQGQSLMTRPLLYEGDYLTAEFGVKNLPAGTYLIKITVGDRSLTEHFVRN